MPSRYFTSRFGTLAKAAAAAGERVVMPPKSDELRSSVSASSVSASSGESSVFSLGRLIFV